MSLKKYLIYQNGKIDDEKSIKNIRKRYPKDDELDAIERILNYEEKDKSKKRSQGKKS